MDTDDWEDIDDKIKETYENLQLRNQALREELEYLQTQNVQFKQRHQVLNGSLLTLNEILEKNAKLFNQLCDDAKSALKVARISGVSPNLPQTVACSNSPKPGTSKACSSLQAIDNVQCNGIVNQAPNLESGNTETKHPAPPSHVQPRLRRKIHIEPINLDEIRQLTEEATMENVEILAEEPEERLTTILEETLENSKNVCVKLQRLPQEIIDMHLQKQTSNFTFNGSALNISSSFSVAHSFLSSTPLKIDAMERLGLTPTLNTSLPQFVSTRKKRTNSATNSKQSTNTIVKKERLTSPRTKVSISPKEGSFLKRGSQKRSSSSSTPPHVVKKKKSSPEKKLRIPKNETLSPKNKKLSPMKENISQSPKKSPTYSRPQRKARPKLLKEESLVTKKRRP